MADHMADIPCAACGDPIGDKRWKMESGRVYHQGCKPKPIPRTERKPEKLGRYAERTARRVLNPGQESLDD